MRNIYGLIAVALLLVPTAAIQAAGGHKGGHPCCCDVKCPRCDHVCKFSVDLEDETRHCYCVEEKAICIPRVVFPWQKRACCGDEGCCDGHCDGGCCNGGCNGCGKKCCKYNNGACKKYVRVLKKFEYQCKVCKYKWNAVLPSCDGRDGCDGCDVGGAGSESQIPEPPAVDARRLYSKPIFEQTSLAR